MFSNFILPLSLRYGSLILIFKAIFGSCNISPFIISAPLMYNLSINFLAKVIFWLKNVPMSGKKNWGTIVS